MNRTLINPIERRLREFGAAASVALALSLGAHAQARIVVVKPEVIEARLESAPQKQSERGATLRKYFAESGCTPERLTDDEVKGQKEPNIVCVLPGKDSRQIIVGGHYDFIDAGHGVVDNWSGASMLPSLLQSLGGEQRDHTFVFVAFTAEEKGELGSQSYVDHLSQAQRDNITAMVNLDTLGLGPTKVWASDSSKPMVNVLFNLANRMKLPLAVVNVDQVGSSDNDMFRRAHIPEICIHSVTPATFHILHSVNDTITAIQQKDYYDSYHLVAAYLAVIDKAFPERPEAKTPNDGKASDSHH